MSAAATSTTPAPALTRAHGVAIVAAVLAAATWSLWPLDTPGVMPSSLSSEASSLAGADADALARDDASPEQTLPELDLAAYCAPIWVAPPPPPTPPPPPPPQPPKPPLRLQLIAIIEEPASIVGTAGSNTTITRAALCYDPERDAMVTIRDGQRAPAAGEPAWGGRTGIARVTRTSLTLGEGPHSSTLTLAGPNVSATEGPR